VIPRKFAELREIFQALSGPERYSFDSPAEAMGGGIIST